MVSQLFLIWGQGPYIIGWIGVFIMVLGLIFAAQVFRPRVSRMEAAE